MEGPDITLASKDPPSPVIRETILLVEDDRDLRELAQATLSALNYRVLTAETGLDAIDIWTEHKREIALLLTDIVMPKGISGIDIGEGFQQDKPSLKIVYTSGYLLETIPGSTTILQTGVFVPKPYIPSQLARLIRQILDE